MKTIILFLIFTVGCAAQTNLSERDAINKDHIDLTKQQVYFEIHGVIELNGHAFLADTCADPFMFFANADGIKICRKENVVEYKHRRCGVKDCPILHLELIVAIITPTPQPWYYRFNQLYGPATTPAVIEDSVK